MLRCSAPCSDCVAPCRSVCAASARVRSVATCSVAPVPRCVLRCSVLRFSERFAAPMLREQCHVRDFRVDEPLPCTYGISCIVRLATPSKPQHGMLCLGQNSLLATRTKESEQAYTQRVAGLACTSRSYPYMCACSMMYRNRDISEALGIWWPFAEQTNSLAFPLRAHPTKHLGGASRGCRYSYLRMFLVLGVSTPTRRRTTWPMHAK